MKTANLVGVSADHSARDVVDYNLQSKKTEGSWRGTKAVSQDDLVSFHGDSNLPGLSIQQKGNLFKSQMNASRNAHNRRLQGQNPHHDWAQCHTLIQSYEFSPNKELRPKQVHQMGNEFFKSVQSYLQQRYGYSLASGMVSTHIDRDQNEFNNPNKKVNRLRQPHLHNHIVLPDYNMQGESLSPYLRKSDIYKFQSMNDGISAHHNLNDYYFSKLHRQIYPFSAYSRNEYGNHKNNQEVIRDRSNLQRAWRAFRGANDFAWDEVKPQHHNRITKNDFHKAVHVRNEYLRQRYHFHTNVVKDKQTGKKRHVFTLGNFDLTKNMRQQWYNINNLRVLRWHDQKEMRAERLLWQFDYHGVLNRPVSYNAYKRTVTYATQKLPSIGKIVKPSMRQKFKVNLASAYQHVEIGLKQAKKRVKHAKIKMNNKYREYTKYGGQVLHGVRNLYDRMTNERYKIYRHNIFAVSVNNSINQAYKNKTKKRRQTRKRKRIAKHIPVQTRNNQEQQRQKNPQYHNDIHLE